MTVDTIIVGQGLAGTLLGLALLEQGQKTLVIDNGHKSAATKVAAGIMNPVTGSRLKRFWDSDKDQQFIVTYYQKLEKTLGVSFLHRHKLLRFLSKPRELDAYEKRLNDADYQALLQDSRDPSDFQGLCDIGQRQFLLDPVYQVDTQTLLTAACQYFKERQAYLCSEFSHDDLIIKSDGVSWQGHKAKRLIFCEGARGCENPLFKNLNFENAMGDILEIECFDLPEKTILNHGKWLCPMGENRYKYGATSYWQDSSAARRNSESELRASLKTFLKVPFEVLGVSHGVRPVFKDRRPYAEMHSDYANVGIINGLGARGVGLAPVLVGAFSEGLI